ncbi:hypothetical protein [Olsenella sp. Marseille-P4559]|nr:hypothetical protein [Olsenella sp. Marseille-P4559]
MVVGAPGNAFGLSELLRGLGLSRSTYHYGRGRSPEATGSPGPGRS